MSESQGSGAGLDLERRQTLESRIGSSLLDIAPESGWRRVELRAAVTVLGYQLRLAIIMDDGSTYVPESSAIDPDALSRIDGALPELRRVMYRPGRGTWFSMRLCLNSPESYAVAYNFHHDPEWHPPLPPEAYLRDFEQFPRDPFHIPLWQRERLEQADPGKWEQGGVVHVGSMTAEDQSELADEITALLIEDLPPGYVMFDISFNTVGRFVDIGYSVLDVFSQRLDWTPAAELLHMLSRLRQGMYRPGQGTWFGVHLRLDYIARLALEFNWTEEPRWEQHSPPRAAYQQELELFPREVDAVPTWLEQKATQVGPVLRIVDVYDRKILAPAYPHGYPMWIDRPKLSDRERAEVLAYLEQAPVVLTLEGFEPDMLEPAQPNSIPREFHTDGTWIWPASVSYYMREHNATPQAPFIEHIRGLGYHVPDVDEQTRSTAVTTIEREWKQ
ncbi:hypothetical protein [Nocardia sp. NPDC056100]|uniref:hypothetical protein n=1 Tax=Nocardia sp. NPDC056100 TaxID=3345712 RepID=UPI0035DA2D60